MSFRSETYLDYVRAHECCSCWFHAPSEPHHCAPAGISPAITGKGTSQKAGDQWTIPLCRNCHDRWHSSLTYRQLGARNAAQSDELLAQTQLNLMAHWIRMLDLSSDRF
jgi:hypothetical protein